MLYRTMNRFTLLTSIVFFSVLFGSISLVQCNDIETSYSFENTNILSYNAQKKVFDFNRLRFEGNVYNIFSPEFTGKIIVDNETYFTQENSSLTNKVDFYRGYINYIGQEHSVYFGRQRIPFGVGRIWTPMDIFNPLDSTSIEPDEREGTDALRYEYNINELSQLDITVSKEKAALRLKGFLDYGDIAAIVLVDNKCNSNIIGWEIEGELPGSGIELRSEGGFFYDRYGDEYHTEFIIGAEYGFPNSITLLTEYYYNADIDHFGITISYQASPLLFFSFLNILNIDDSSYFSAPTFNYSLSDETSLSGGFFIYGGDDSSEFGVGSDLVFLNWFIHF